MEQEQQGEERFVLPKVFPPNRLVEVRMRLEESRLEVLERRQFGEVCIQGWRLHPGSGAEDRILEQEGEGWREGWEEDCTRKGKQCTLKEEAREIYHLEDPRCRYSCRR